MSHHHHLLIDTCVWLNLSIDPVAEEIVEQLEQLVNIESFTLVVPAIIEEEFERHKPEHAKKLASKLSSRVRETLKYARQFNGPEENEVLLPALETFIVRIEQVSTAAEKMIERIDKILRHPDNKRITSSSDLLEKTVRRGCDKKAPFINNKNSVADAVILESFLEFISKHAENHNCTFSFVTVNTNDFSDRKDNRKPHPELGEPFSSGEVRFSINIADEINTLVNTLLPADTRSKNLLSNEIIQHVYSWPDAGLNLSICPRCKENKMEYIGGHPSQYGGWSVWQICRKCGFKWDTGIPIDD